jgi:hypothetical protein
VELVVGEVMEIDGAVTSPVRVTVMVSVEVFPAASLAVTVIGLLPTFSGILETLQEVVPEAVPLPPVSELLHVTWVTPTLSLAVPPMVSADEDPAL